MHHPMKIVLSIMMILVVGLSACAPQAAATQAVEPVVQPEAAGDIDTPAETGPELGHGEVPATGEIMLPEVDPAEVQGNIISAGSSTVYPLSEAVVSLFKEEGYTGNIEVNSIGSGGGFERFCKTGETDISNASRAIKESEIENCRAIGRNPIEFRTGTDAMVIAIHPENDFLTDVTADELAVIFSDQTINWSDVNPDWPAEPVKRYTPGTDSGTYDFFIEVIMQPAYDGDAERAMQAFQNASNLQQSEDDNVLVQGVRGDPYSIAFFGFAYFQENQDVLKAVSVNGIEPSFKTAEDGSYILSRPLFIYSDAQIMKEKPQVASFINFYLTRVNDVIEDAGYFPASEEALNSARQAWLDAVK